MSLLSIPEDLLSGHLLSWPSWVLLLILARVSWCNFQPVQLITQPLNKWQMTWQGSFFQTFVHCCLSKQCSGIFWDILRYSCVLALENVRELRINICIFSGISYFEVWMSCLHFKNLVGALECHECPCIWWKSVAIIVMLL